jgi:chromosome segregation ATPase
MKILERLRLQPQIIITGKTGKDNPLLKKQLEQTQKDLNLILNKWKFGDAPLKSAKEFLNNFEPWINKQLEEQKEYKKKEEVWNNTEQDYLNKIKELKAIKGDGEEVEELIAERDEAIRDKKTLEQENLTLNNQLKLKQQEANNKDKSLEKLKKEQDQKEVNHQKQLKEKNGLITTLNQEIKQHKEKYTKQGKLLDTEQLECKRLEEENEKLQEEIKKIKEKGWK